MVDIFSDGTDPARDHPKKRPLQVDTENDFVLEQHPKYGMFSIHRERGQIPAALSGFFSSTREAELAIKNYLAKQK